MYFIYFIQIHLNLFKISFSIFLKVQLLQSSNKRDPNLIINNQSTFVEGKSIKFHNTDEDYNNIIRTYIDAVTSNLISLLEIKHLSNVMQILHEHLLNYKSHWIFQNLLRLWKIFKKITFKIRFNFLWYKTKCNFKIHLFNYSEHFNIS